MDRHFFATNTKQNIQQIWLTNLKKLHAYMNLKSLYDSKKNFDWLVLNKKLSKVLWTRVLSISEIICSVIVFLFHVFVDACIRKTVFQTWRTQNVRIIRVRVGAIAVSFLLSYYYCSSMGSALDDTSLVWNLASRSAYVIHTTNSLRLTITSNRSLVDFQHSDYWYQLGTLKIHYI